MFTQGALSSTADPGQSTRRPINVRGYPLIGVIPRLLRDPPRTIAELAYERPREIVSFNLGPATLYLVSRPEHVEGVLNDQTRSFVKGPMWRPLRRLTGNGLVTSEGEAWAHDRRLLQPLFSPKHLASIVDHASEIISATAADLEAKGARGAPIDVSDEMMQLTQRVLLETLFGATLDRHEAKSLAAAILSAFREVNLRMFLHFIPDWLPLPGELRLQRAIHTIDEAMGRLFNESPPSSGSGGNMLSLLRQARDSETGRRLVDQQVRDHLITMFVGGNETTAVAMTWLFYLLDEHPAVRQKLQAELASVLGGRTPKSADLQALRYTKMVVQETLRLYPPGWFIPRVAAKDAVIGGFRIPSGSLILVSPYVTHHDPRLWEHPERFDPERFAPERAAGRHRFAYYPFGGGPRQCISMSFALMEAQLIVAVMAQRFRLRRVPGSSVELSSAITLRPRENLRMLVEPVAPSARKADQSLGSAAP